MKTIDIKIPDIGTEVNSFVITKIYKKDGDRVEKDELVLEASCDKCLLGIHAEEYGEVIIFANEGQEAKSGDSLFRIKIIPTKIQIQREIVNTILESIDKKMLLESNEFIGDMYVYDEDCKAKFDEAYDEFIENFKSQYGI